MEGKILSRSGLLSSEVNSSDDVSSLIEPSEEMLELLEHHKQVRTWIRDVEERIAKLETSYLEETPMGNIVRGWEQSRVFSSRSRRVADKERLFSHSSYTVWLESRSRPPSFEDAKEESAGFVKNKRVRRGVQRRKEYRKVKQIERIVMKVKRRLDPQRNRITAQRQDTPRP